jgi:hypothetical protein
VDEIVDETVAVLEYDGAIGYHASKYVFEGSAKSIAVT